MPKWTNKDERMFDEIRKNLIKDGKSKKDAEEIAARTVNKHRRERGRTPNKTTQGTGNPNTRLEDRTVEQLRNRASQLNIRGRSTMLKAELIQAIRARN